VHGHLAQLYMMAELWQERMYLKLNKFKC
jgi:hypothetical protein